MIGYLRGEVLEKSEGRILVIVPSGAAGGVGYQVAVPGGSAYLGLLPGAAVALHVYTHVREDALDLFGFLTHVEKELFLTLLGVNGIGPKLALSVLSATHPAELIQAILGDDTAFLTRIPGIGKKTAERVVLEIADKIRKRMESGAWVVAGPAGGGRELREGTDKQATLSPEASDVWSDAKAALVGLGYRENEVAAVLSRIGAGGPAPRGAEELVRTALRQMV